MTKSPKIEKNQLIAISRFFGSAVVTELGRRGMSPLLMRLAHESFLLDRLCNTQKVGHLFELAFDVLKAKRNRAEYVYKAALTQKVLLGTHSLQTASLLTEFRVGQCKADLVILNGTGTAYEIKSERDSLSRLDKQIGAYRRVFAKVYVIAAENHIDAILSRVPDDVGILRLTERYQISQIREAKECVERTSAIAIFEAMRISEAKKILEVLGIQVPSVPNTQLYGHVREGFRNLPSRDVHYAMVKVLKKTRALSRLSDFLDKLPASLHVAAMSVPLRAVDRGRLASAVNTRIYDALAWG